MKGKRVLLTGEPMALLMAEQPGPLEKTDSFHLAVAGAEYNVAVGLARLGHQPEYVTRLGEDPFGKRIAAGLKAEGIGTGWIEWDQEHSTGMMLKGKAEKGEDPDIFYFRKGSAASCISENTVTSLELSDYDALHLTGIFPALNENTLKAAAALERKAHAAGIPVFFDPNLRPSLWQDEETMKRVLLELISGADYVFPGIAEGRLLTGREAPEEIAEALHQAGAKHVVIKLGPEGAYCQTGFVAGFVAKQVVDTVGAGDGFAVGVISAVLEGLSMEEAVRRGNAIGCIQVTHRGDNEGLPDRAELEAFLAQAERIQV